MEFDIVEYAADGAIVVYASRLTVPVCVTRYPHKYRVTGNTVLPRKICESGYRKIKRLDTVFDKMRARPPTDTKRCTLFLYGNISARQDPPQSPRDTVTIE